MSERVWLVSACLLGWSCRYDAQSRKTPLPVPADDAVVPICPEAAGGLGTPRQAAHLCGGDGHAVLDASASVRTHAGEDVSAAFVRGAQFALDAAVAHGASHACLKARSPSCGLGEAHTDAGLRPGDGVTAAALRRAGLVVISEEDGPVSR